jgi:hypothetical protein
LRGGEAAGILACALPMFLDSKPLDDGRALVARDARIDVDDVVSQFLEHGWARVGKVLSDEGAHALCQRTDELMLGRVSYPGLFFQLDASTGHYEDLPYGRGYEGPSLSYRKIEKLELDPLFRSWIENPVFEAIARAVIPGDIVVYRAMIMSKPREGGTDLPWHQDGGQFWGIDRDPVLQIWTALDDAPVEAGCVEVLDRSHVEGLATPNGGVVPRDMVEARDADEKALRLPVRAGDVLLVHNHVWHRSGRNVTGRPRRAMSVCYMTAETRCLRKKRAPRTFVPVFAARTAGQ